MQFFRSGYFEWRSGRDANKSKEFAECSDFPFVSLNSRECQCERLAKPFDELRNRNTNEIAKIRKLSVRINRKQSANRNEFVYLRSMTF